jgi:hypothetical protein
MMVNNVNALFVVLLLCVGCADGMFLKKTKNCENEMEIAFEKEYLQGIGMEVKRKGYSKMLQMSNNQQSEETEYAKVIIVPQEEIKQKIEKLRKSNLRYRTQQQEQQVITSLTNKTDLTPSSNDELKQIPFEYSVTAVSALV